MRNEIKINAKQSLMNPAKTYLIECMLFVWQHTDLGVEGGWLALMTVEINTDSHFFFLQNKHLARGKTVHTI